MKNVKKIKIGFNNLYLFKNKENEYLLLDTGMEVKKKKILKKLENIVGDLRKIKVIAISHSHADHVGNLKMLIDEIKDVKIIAHKNCKKILETGKSVIPNGFYPLTKKISKKLKTKKNFTKNIFPKVEKKDMKKINFVDFSEKDEISLLGYGFGNIKIIETTGHSDDSLSLVVFDEKNNSKYLFCGDLVQNICFKFPLIPLFAENDKDLIKNWRKIVKSDYDGIFMATGKMVTIEDLVKKLKKLKEI